jgi:hypothetical protein
MAKIEIGYYELGGNTQHTYAKMTTDNNLKVKFPCYGGTNGDDIKFPVTFWSPDSCNSKKMGEKLDCDDKIARQLAQWVPIETDFTRTDYDRITDASGIVYGLTGVCHQMCNTILCSSNVGNPPRAGVNWPPSLAASKFVYGFRGAVYPPPFSFVSRDKLITDMIKIYQNFNQQHEIDGDNISNSAIRDAEHDAEQLESEAEDALINRLKHGYDENALEELLENDVKARYGLRLYKKNKFFTPVSSMYQEMMNSKNEVDCELIGGNIHGKDYAAEIHEILQRGASRYLDIVGEEEFERVFGSKPNELQTDIIEADKVPDFSNDQYVRLAGKFAGKI